MEMDCKNCKFNNSYGCKTRGEFGVDLCRAHWSWLRWDPEEGWVPNDSDPYAVVGVWDPDFGWLPFFSLAAIPFEEEGGDDPES
jgi:hypothetical protein